MREIRLTWDDGWSGKHVHSLGPDTPTERPLTITVSQTDDETLLYVEMDGEKFRVCRKQRAGFK